MRPLGFEYVRERLERTLNPPLQLACKVHMYVQVNMITCSSPPNSLTRLYTLSLLPFILSIHSHMPTLLLPPLYFLHSDA